jgi:hypothetical protein
MNEVQVTCPGCGKEWLVRTEHGLYPMLAAGDECGWSRTQYRVGGRGMVTEYYCSEQCGIPVAILMDDGDDPPNVVLYGPRASRVHNKA